MILAASIVVAALLYFAAHLHYTDAHGLIYNTVTGKIVGPRYQ